MFTRTKHSVCIIMIFFKQPFASYWYLIQNRNLFRWISRYPIMRKNAGEIKFYINNIDDNSRIHCGTSHNSLFDFKSIFMTRIGTKLMFVRLVINGS